LPCARYRHTPAQTLLNAGFSPADTVSPYGTALALSLDNTFFDDGGHMWSWICCYVMGHDYSVSCDSGAMFLRCIVCGRRSQGWVVHANEHQTHAPGRV
jgi:hypothetical protein